MNLEIANSMSGYIETLYNINQNLIKICGVDILLHTGYDLEKIILDIIRDIPRVIPYSYDDSKKTLVCKGKNGLLEYQNEIKYLKNDYEDILKNHKGVLDNIRKIRNKYEHKMHDVKYKSSGAGSTVIFDIEFEIDSKLIKVYAGELIKLIEKINVLFSKILKEIEQFAYDNGKQNHAYYERISRFDFKDFNKILESDLLRTIGRIMNPY